MPPFDAAMAKRHKKGLSARQVRQWSAVATSVYDACVKNGGKADRCEARAIRAANSQTGEPELSTEQSRPFHAIVAHISSTATRREWLDGREYLVARVVPLVEAVLNEYFIPAEEIAACLPSWSDLPLPIGHPQSEYGEYISGKSPEMLEQSVGRFFSPAMDGSRLVGEVWLDIEKCNRLGGDAAEVLRRVEANEIVEVSTAFYPQTAMQQGLFNGTAYRGIHRNLRPDHLALLPNGIGACHAGMGCGIRAAQAAAACACVGSCTCEEGDTSMEIEVDMKHPGKLRQALRTLFAFANGADPDEAEPDTDEQEHTGDSEKDKEGEREDQGVLTTHLTHDDIKLALYAELGKALQRDNAPYYGLDVCDIEASSVIYRDGAQFYRRVYTIGDNNAVILSGTPEEVQRDTRYIPIAAAAGEGVTTNTTQQPRGDTVTTYKQKGEVMLTKPQLIAQILVHDPEAWSEEHAPALECMEERILEQMLDAAKRRKEQAPLSLDVLKTFLDERERAQEAKFDKKLASYSQNAEEKYERERLEQVLVTHGWPAEEAEVLSIQALRRMHQTLDPVSSYVSNGLPRMHVQSDEDTYPADEPDWS